MRSLSLLALASALALAGCGSSGDDGGDGGGGTTDAVTPTPDAGGGVADTGGVVDTLPEVPRIGSIGARCEDDAACGQVEGIECFQSVPGVVEWPGGYCSRSCGKEGDPECGPGAACATGGSGGMSSMNFAFCAKECKETADCRKREGYTCKIVIPGLGGFCAPPGL